MKFIACVAIGTITGLLGTPSLARAASFSAFNSNVVKFNASTSEAALIASGAASITIGNTRIYIGTNQVSSINQDPIVTSFTNGSQNWVRSYDSSGIDARGIGLLWDEASQNLYGVFSADGGSVGENSFSAATQDGWLPSYGSGGGSNASVLLKLNPDNGVALTGTYIRAKLTDGRTNTVVPTGLDFIDDKVIFFGNSFFTPLDTDGNPFEEKTTPNGSPFPYRLVLTTDLSTALNAEAIGWNGVTEFSPIQGSSDETPPSEDSEPTEPDEDTEQPPVGGGNVPEEEPQETIDNEGDVKSVPEPGFAVGFVIVGAAALWRRTRRVASGAMKG